MTAEGGSARFSFLRVYAHRDGWRAADLRGFVSEGAAGVLQFQFCNGPVLGRELFPIEDKTPSGALWQGVGAVRQIMLRRYQPLYVEARGERGKTNVTGINFSERWAPSSRARRFRATLRRTFACLRRARDRRGGSLLPTPRQCSICPTKCP